MSEQAFIRIIILNEIEYALVHFTHYVKYVVILPTKWNNGINDGSTVAKVFNRKVLRCS